MNSDRRPAEEVEKQKKVNEEKARREEEAKKEKARKEKEQEEYRKLYWAREQSVSADTAGANNSPPPFNGQSAHPNQKSATTETGNAAGKSKFSMEIEADQNRLEREAAERRAEFRRNQAALEQRAQQEAQKSNAGKTVVTKSSSTDQSSLHPLSKIARDGLLEEVNRLTGPKKKGGYDLQMTVEQIHAYNEDTDKIKTDIQIEAIKRCKILLREIAILEKAQDVTADYLIEKLEDIKSNMKSTGRHFRCLRGGALFGSWGITGHQKLNKIIKHIKDEDNKTKKASSLPKAGQ